MRCPRPKAGGGATLRRLAELVEARLVARVPLQHAVDVNLHLPKGLHRGSQGNNQVKRCLLR